MKIILLFTSLTLAVAGCHSRPEREIDSRDGSTVELFNDAILQSSSSEDLPMLITTGGDAWSPIDVNLDEYGAVVKYAKTGTFEDLRRGLNQRYAEHEVDTFADDPEMGLWRNEEAGFAIQLTEDSDTYSVIYVSFLDEEAWAKKVAEVLSNHPELLDGPD